MLLEHPVEEYALRIQRLTKEMQKQNLDAILVTAPDNMRYFCGQRSIVWDSNVSMPGVLVITSSGDMSIAGSQSNHGTAVATSCVDEDQFVPFSNGGHPAKNQPMSFPEAVLRVFANLKLEKARIGMEYGKGCRVRMIHDDYNYILSHMPQASFVDASAAIWAVRGIKTPLEQNLLRQVNAINTKLFLHAFERIIPGVTTERELYNSMAAEAFTLGCSDMLELDIRCSKDRYEFVNCPPSDFPISNEPGTMLIIDGGPSYQGYYSDIIRMGVIGKPSSRQQELYNISLEGNAAGLSKVKDGTPIAEVVQAVDQFYEKAGVDAYNKTKGWIGHSLGLNVHEYPCLETGVDTILKAGMVMTIEPCLHDPQLGMFDLEQNFIVTENGYELLSQAPTELRRII